MGDGGRAAQGEEWVVVLIAEALTPEAPAG